MTRLLIHSCCAHCTLQIIFALKKTKQYDPSNLSLFYYNPNIHPRSEYLARMEAMKKIAAQYQLKLIIPPWRPIEYFTEIKKNRQILKKMNNQSTKLRCLNCWFLRLNKTCSYAQENNFPVISSTLLSSTYQNTDQIKTITKQLAQKYQRQVFLPQPNQQIKTSGFYKQNYCGCAYSLVEKMVEKYFN